MKNKINGGLIWWQMLRINRPMADGRKKPGGEAWARAVGDMSRGARPGGAGGGQSSSSQASGIGVRRLPVLGG